MAVPYSIVLYPSKTRLPVFYETDNSKTKLVIVNVIVTYSNRYIYMVVTPRLQLPLLLRLRTNSVSMLLN